MEQITRRTLLAITASLAGGTFLPPLHAADQQSNPWSKDELMEPATLARLLATPGNHTAPVVLCVAFPFLYRQRHITNSRFAGPTSKPEGITALKSAVSALPKDSHIVVYCGCCPMVRCPNIRPAYQTLKDLGLQNIHVLDLPTNFHTDWTAKRYPVEPPAGPLV